MILELVRQSSFSLLARAEGSRVALIPSPWEMVSRSLVHVRAVIAALRILK